MAEDHPPPSRYRILGALHKGGMGEIWLARVEGAEGFARRVVLKGLLPQLADDEVSLSLFRREATLMGRLIHPNVVQVLDFVYVEGRPYLAMEYVQGRNLHQIIQRAGALGGKIPPRFAGHLVAEALRGLHFAHRAKDDEGRPLGIVHRDVSPGNVLASFFGEVKVTDFGIAMAEGLTKYTGPRSIRGKARYTAPEIIAGQPATVQSDLYAAGVVLAEALTGRPLWDRGPLPATLLAIVSEPLEETLGRVFEHTPHRADLAVVLRKALARRPEDRFGSALEMALAVDRVVAELGGPVSQAQLGEYLQGLFKKRSGAESSPPEAPEPAPARPSEAPVAIPRATSVARPARLQSRPPVMAERAPSPAGRVAEVGSLRFVSSSPRTGELVTPNVEAPLLAELFERPSQTDAEPSRPLPEPALPVLVTSKWHGAGFPPWLLLVIGILIGGAVAMSAAILALAGS